jgi:uncharacterized protein (TIGR01319 family)
VVTDVGSTTTKAILFRRKGTDWQFLFEESPTTVEKPYEDVTIGVLRAIRALEQASGETLLSEGRPTVPYLSTSSAGGGLAMVVTGLVQDITAESADRVALGAGAIVQEIVAMNDGRSPYRKIEDLKRLRPDMVLLAGGFDGDALSGPVFLAELLLEAGLHPKLNPDAKLPVIYAGNSHALEFVRRALDDRFMFHPVPNLRPTGDRENFEPTRDAIHELFMNHVMSQAPGYERLKGWVAAPIVPTPAGFAMILGLVSKELKTRVLAIDVGGATTDVFTADNGSIFRTVSANLGLSYSIMNVAMLSGVGEIRKLLDLDMSETELWNRIGNKHINPTRLADNARDMRVEWAVASIAIREAVQTHFKVMQGSAHLPAQPQLDVNDILRDPPKPILTRPSYGLRDYGMVIGSGGILSHSPRDAAARILMDGLELSPGTALAVDSAFMFPHLGVLSEVNPELAHELFFKLGIVQLGKADPKRVFPADYLPPARTKVRSANCEVRSEKCEENNPQSSVRSSQSEVRSAEVFQGRIELRRELAIPGQVLVKAGDRTQPDTLLARSTRQFLRPFFLHVAAGIHVAPAELGKYMLKKVGDEVEFGEAIAGRPRRWMSAETFHSPVEGRIEKILPDGVLVVREKPEKAREYTTVDVARELDMEPEKIKPYVKVKPGDELDRGQWIAAVTEHLPFKLCTSPVRGKVNRIEWKMGMVIIEPLLEELEVYSWLPGTVETVTDKGCLVAAQGTIIQGVWGTGGERHGRMQIADCRIQNAEYGSNPRILESLNPLPGAVVVSDFADAKMLARLKERRVAGLIVGGVNLQDVLDPCPGFTVAVLQGFGEQKIAPEVLDLLKRHEGKLALLDGTTQLRVGVKRPRVVLPEN